MSDAETQEFQVVEEAPVAVEEAPAAVEAEVIPDTSDPTYIQAIIKSAYARYTVENTANNYGRPPSVEVQDIRLYPTHVEAIVNNINKTISLADFKEILDGLMSATEVKLPAFQMPYGCYLFGMQGRTLQISCYYPAQKKTIIYQDGGRDEKKFELPFPNVVINHSLKKEGEQWAVERTKYYCTSKNVPQLPDKPITSTDRSNDIFLIPVSNMYETADMCFGANAMPIRFNQNLRGLDYYYQVLFDAPYNNDLGVKALGLSSPREWYAEWAEMNEFPYDRLKSRR